ncbi:GerAB/ArcD/ProY family transporter [Clostridium neuense]|uniref:GerAB/ArcD/ProY family transporter n=1 Tax=Clostridium neuense TaxID=1728934 RepID=A0ABW8TKD4_9CLOT
MIKVKNDITSKQFFVFVVTSEIGTGIITLPNQLAEKVGHDGWIPTLIGGMVCSLLVLIQLILLRKHSNKSIIQINKLLYGKWLGQMFNLLLIAYTFFGGCVIVRRIGDIVASEILKDTPSLVTGFFTIIPSLYLLYYGLTPICRVAHEFFFIVTVTVLMYVVALRDIDIMNLLPIGEAGMIPILKAVKTTVYTYIGFELVVYIYPCVKDKENALKYAELAVLVVTVFFTSTVALVTGVFGENMLKELPTSLIFLSGIINIPVIERIDLFFIILWIPLVACVARNFMFCTYYGLEKMFSAKKRNLKVTLLVLLTVLLSRIPKTFSETEKFVGVFSIYSLIIDAFFIVCFGISIIKDKLLKNKGGT